MRLKKLSLQNIRSYENLEIEFPKGSILLSGEIGAGKTSILLGIQFALFGLQPGQKGSSLLRAGENEAYARIEIEIDEEIINLERTIKKNKSGTITQEKNIFTTNYKRIELSTSEMKSKVIELLKYPKEFAKKSNILYKFTVYTPQEEMKQIIEERPEIRLDTIRHIFGIDRYKRIKENTGILLQRIKESFKIKEILVGELSLLKEKLKIESEKKIVISREINNTRIELNKKLELKKILDNEKEHLDKILEEKKEIKQGIEKKQALIQGKKSLETRLKKEIEYMQKEVKYEIDFSYEQLNNIQNLLSKHKNNLDDKNNDYLKINSKISVLESKKENPLKLKEKIISLENCPTCFQSVSIEHKKKIEKRTNFEIEDINRELEREYFLKNQIIKDIEKIKELIKGYETDLNELWQNKVKFENQKTIQTKIKSDIFILERTTNEINELEKEIKKLKDEQIDFPDEKYKLIIKDSEELANEIRINEIRLAEKNKELEIIKKIINELSEDISKKEKIKAEMVYFRNLHDWISEKFLSMISITEKNVLSKIRNQFSEVFSNWFGMLVSQDLNVRLDENFTPIISNKDYEMDYSFLSGGERTAVAMAYRLALNQVLNSILSRIKTRNIVILDEPTDGFASEQIDKMRDLFQQLKTEQLIIVSHEQKIEGFVDNVIKIKKDFSSIAEETKK